MRHVLLSLVYCNPIHNWQYRKWCFSVFRGVNISITIFVINPISVLKTLKNVTFTVLNTEILHILSSGSDVDCGSNIQNRESQCFGPWLSVFKTQTSSVFTSHSDRLEHERMIAFHQWYSHLNDYISKTPSKVEQVEPTGTIFKCGQRQCAVPEFFGQGFFYFF